MGNINVLDRGVSILFYSPLAEVVVFHVAEAGTVEPFSYAPRMKRIASLLHLEVLLATASPIP